MTENKITKEEAIAQISERIPRYELWGLLAEEAAELAQAALKMQRLYGDNKPRKAPDDCTAAVIEEHADISLVFQLLHWDDKEERKKIEEQKALRTIKYFKEIGVL